MIHTKNTFYTQIMLVRGQKYYIFFKNTISLFDAVAKGYKWG